MHRSIRRAMPLVACLALTAPATAQAALSAVGPTDPATNAPAY